MLAEYVDFFFFKYNCKRFAKHTGLLNRLPKYMCVHTYYTLKRIKYCQNYYLLNTFKTDFVSAVLTKNIFDPPCCWSFIHTNIFFSYILSKDLPLFHRHSQGPCQEAGLKSGAEPRSVEDLELNSRCSGLWELIVVLSQTSAMCRHSKSTASLAHADEWSNPTQASTLAN